MNQTDLSAIIDVTEGIIQLLSKYENLTDNMISADLEVIQQVLLDRQNIVNQVEALKKQRDNLVNKQPIQMQRLLNLIIRYENTDGERLHDELLALKRKADEMKMIWQRIVKKEDTVRNTVQADMDKIKASIENSNKDKKLINYMNSASGATDKGKLLDSST